jgi:hypothetical protein
MPGTADGTAEVLAVPDAASLALLRQRLEEKTSELQQAIEAGGPRSAAAAIAAAPAAAPALLTQLLGLRSGEVRRRVWPPWHS